MTNKTLVRIRVRVRAWIKIYICHTENTELLPKSFTTAIKKYILKLIKLQSLTAKCCKTRKIQPCEVLQFFIYLHRAGKNSPFSRQFQIGNGTFFVRLTKYVQNHSQTSQGYIFRFLQHFATKLCNFTNSRMLCLAVVIDFLHRAFIKI